MDVVAGGQAVVGWQDRIVNTYSYAESLVCNFGAAEGLGTLRTVPANRKWYVAMIYVQSTRTVVATTEGNQEAGFYFTPSGGAAVKNNGLIRKIGNVVGNGMEIQMASGFFMSAGDAIQARGQNNDVTAGQVNQLVKFLINEFTT